MNESEDDEPLAARDGMAEDSHDGFEENDDEDGDGQAAIEDVTNDQQMDDDHRNFNDEDEETGENLDMIENLVTDENAEEMDVDESSVYTDDEQSIHDFDYEQDYHSEDENPDLDLANDGFVLMGPSGRGRDRSNQFNMNWAVR